MRINIHCAHVNEILKKAATFQSPPTSCLDSFTQMNHGTRTNETCHANESCLTDESCHTQVVIGECVKSRIDEIEGTNNELSAYNMYMQIFGYMYYTSCPHRICICRYSDIRIIQIPTQIPMRLKATMTILYLDINESCYTYQ